MRSLVLLVAALAACGSDSNPSIDAPKGADAPRGIDAPLVDARMIDAAPPDALTLVQTVDCAGVTPAQSIITVNLSYSPSTATINVNDVVQFTTTASHDVQPNATGSDPGIHVPFSQIQCKKFTASGTYGFHCGPHNFTGSITVN